MLSHIKSLKDLLYTASLVNDHCARSTANIIIVQHEYKQTNVEAAAEFTNLTALTDSSLLGPLFHNLRKQKSSLLSLSSPTTNYE